MADNKKYYKLDDIGVVGKQVAASPQALARQSKKTGEAIRKIKMGNAVIEAASGRRKKAS